MSLLSLARRPSPERITIQSLLERVREGRVRVPPFQRALRWNLSDAELLIDSVVRGYPIGTLLLWKREAEAECIQIGSITLNVDARTDALWVVDGQQRITALVNALFPPTQDVDARKPLLLEWDLEADKTVRASAPVTPTSIRVPLDRVVDASDLGEWVLERGLARDDARRVFELARVIREYEILGYVVESSDERVLRRVFARTNTSGKRLRADEVFNALHGETSSEGPNDLRTLAQSLEPLGFGNIDTRWLHQSVLAVAGVDATKSQKGQEVPAGAIARAREPIRQAAVFLVEDARVPIASLLPYGLVVPVLALFFQHHPSPSERSKDLLARWVWRGAITGAHRGDVIPERRKNFQAIVAEDEEESVQNLLSLVSTTPHELPELGRLNAKDAASRLWMLVLVSFVPRDLSTGDPANLGQLLDKKWIRLPALVPKSHESALRRIPELVANRILTTSMDNDAIERLRSDESVMASHCMSDDVIKLLEERREMDAVAARSSLLCARAIAFVNQRTRWGESDRPSIAYLMQNDDE